MVRVDQFTYQVNYKMHLGQPSVPGTAWNGYEHLVADVVNVISGHLGTIC